MAESHVLPVALVDACYLKKSETSRPLERQQDVKPPNHWRGNDVDVNEQSSCATPMSMEGSTVKKDSLCGKSVLLSSDANDCANDCYVRQRVGPDCPWSWVIAAACSLLNFFSLAMVRSGSIIFLKTMEYYDVARTEASWPISLVGATCNLSGKQR